MKSPDQLLKHYKKYRKNSNLNKVREEYRNLNAFSIFSGSDIFSNYTIRDHFFILSNSALFIRFVKSIGWHFPERFYGPLLSNIMSSITYHDANDFEHIPFTKLKQLSLRRISSLDILKKIYVYSPINEISLKEVLNQLALNLNIKTGFYYYNDSYSIDRLAGLVLLYLHSKNNASLKKFTLALETHTISKLNDVNTIQFNNLIST